MQLPGWGFGIMMCISPSPTSYRIKSTAINGCLLHDISKSCFVYSTKHIGTSCSNILLCACTINQDAIDRTPCCTPIFLTRSNICHYISSPSRSPNSPRASLRNRRRPLETRHSPIPLLSDSTSIHYHSFQNQQPPLRPRPQAQPLRLPRSPTTSHRPAATHNSRPRCGRQPPKRRPQPQRHRHRHPQSRTLGPRRHTQRLSLF
jgi:hypothetical protein